MFHSVPLQSNTTGFPGLRTSLLLSSVSLSCHKLALSTANWYQWSLKEEGGSAQRDQLISFNKIMGGKEHTSIQKWMQQALHASLIIYRKFLFHLQQTTLYWTFSVMFYLYVCMHACICLLTCIFLPDLMNTIWISCQFRSQNPHFWEEMHFNIQHMDKRATSEGKINWLLFLMQLPQ